jgi:hypothetical protein
VAGTSALTAFWLTSLLTTLSFVCIIHSSAHMNGDYSDSGWGLGIGVHTPLATMGDQAT